MKKAFYLVMALMTTMAMATVSAQVKVMDSNENPEQDSIDKWVVDSIEDWEVDSVEVDTTAYYDVSDEIEELDEMDDFEIQDSKLTKRYGLVVTGGKYGIRDYEKEENVTDVIYDYAQPAYRRKVENEFITYFYVSEGERSGIIGIFESNNRIMTILSPSRSSE